MSDNRGSMIAGFILIALGLSFLAVQFLEDVSGAIVLLALGAAFLIAHVVYRTYGLLVPACILLGLGAGVLAEDFGAGGASVLIGLGTGFIAIWAIDRALTRTGPKAASWWPLIPGGIVLIVGLGSYFGGLESLFPALLGIGLLAIGVFVIVRAVRESGPGR